MKHHRFEIHLVEVEEKNEFFIHTKIVVIVPERNPPNRLLNR